jgi:hypothetical protein
MKRVLLIVAALFALNVSSRAQLMPSTVREIYDFAVGDTFMYYYESDIRGGSPNGNYRSRKTYIVIEKTIAPTNDSVKYLFEMQYEFVHVYYSTGSGIDTILNIFSNLDSFIVPPPFLDTCFYMFTNCCSSCCIDSSAVYLDSTFGGFRKTNEKQIDVCFAHSESNKFTSGIGNVQYHESNEDGLFGTYSQILVYYHKANGERWGTPYYFTIIGVEEKPTIHATLFPNPATEQIEISIPTDAVSKYENLLFNLYDVTGRNILKKA